MATIYLQNVWYVAGHGSEVSGNPLRRVILDNPVVLYREEGALVALEDRCPHRFAPLSMGKRVEGGIQCPYHGLVFAASGKCVHNPHGDGRILPTARVRNYPVVERHGLIWIWPGDLNRADSDLIPDFSYLETGAQKTRSSGYLPTQANYQLLTDNILDLSHADFLHPLLDSGGGVSRQAPIVEDLPDGSVRVSWTWGPAEPMGLFAHLFDDPSAQACTSLAVRWYAPGVMHLRLATAPTREGLSDDSCVSTQAMHMLTPETAHKTHYFYGGVRNFDVDNDAFTAAFNEGARKAFAEEDKPVIEAVQANMGNETDIFALRPLGLVGDAGGVRIRDRLRRLINAERQEVGESAEALKVTA